MGERQTEDLKVPSSILGEGTSAQFLYFLGVRFAVIGHLSAPLRSLPYSLVGQDTWFSPTRPGFDSRWGKTFCLLLLWPCSIFYSKGAKTEIFGSMAEWLRRLIRNQLGVARGSSNLSAVGFCLCSAFLVFFVVDLHSARTGEPTSKRDLGAVRESNPRPLAPKARIIPLDQRPVKRARCGAVVPSSQGPKIDTCRIRTDAGIAQ